MDTQDLNPKNCAVDLPLLPLRDVVVYPYMVIPLFVGRSKSVAALDAALAEDSQIVLATQKEPDDDEPDRTKLYEIGTLATVLQLLKLPDGTVKVLVEGSNRVRLNSLCNHKNYFGVNVTQLEEEVPIEREARKIQLLMNSLWSGFEEYAQMGKKISTEVMSGLQDMKEPHRIVDTIASHMSVKVDEKQTILECCKLSDRIEYLIELIEKELDLLQVEKRVRGRVKKQMEKSQREYYLNEQMKAIQKELGAMDEASSELDKIQEKIKEVGMTEEALEKTLAELGKLRQMSPMSAEAAVVRGYIEWMLNIPWKKRSRVRSNIKQAEKILNQDHYGLEEVKDRILEYLAVQQRVRKIKGPVLCLVGPPGVGKTSLGESIARATNRKFIRMALGGVRDEAEIRGHRRTYIGSMPGKLLQKMSKVGVKNPLFLLDEIDKMGTDMRGDPASALLEVLDPEQNASFNDHYLEVDYDLSDVMFVCTSNSMNIPAPLMDRMEIIRIPGYTEDEKMNIGRRYLVPKQIKRNGIKKDELKIDDDTLLDMIRYYTKESGVRGFERMIAKVCRKIVKAHSLGLGISNVLKGDLLEEYLGVQKFRYGIAGEKDQVGQVTGLAWTQVGGELLTIEATLTKGKGQIVKTGSLGDVMRESIQAAITVASCRREILGISEDFPEKTNVHIHVPEGATPKDGPSAGIAMCTALVSVLTDIPVRADVAMTGEITLRGQVLAIGGLKEKLLAAHRGGVKTVLIPEENAHEIRELPDVLKKELDIRPVKWIDQVLDIALQYTPTSAKALIEKTSVKARKSGKKRESTVSTH